MVCFTELEWEHYPYGAGLHNSHGRVTSLTTLSPSQEAMTLGVLTTDWVRQTWRLDIVSSLRVSEIGAG